MFFAPVHSDFRQEYLLFVDLDVTALCCDGDTTYASKRSLMALNSGYNVVPQDMLAIRRDTPKRLRKYNCRGYGAVLPGTLLPASQRILERCEELSSHDPTKFLDMDRIFFDEEYHTTNAVDHILKDNRIYTETVLRNICFAPPCKPHMRAR